MGRAGFGFLWLILGIVTLGLVGASAYQAGVTAGIAASATETAVAVVPHIGYGFGWGIGFGWIFFPILFLILLFGLFAFVGSRRRGWGGPGGHGHGGYGGWGGRSWDPNGVAPDDLPPPIRSTLERWHAGAHGPVGPSGEQGSGATSGPSPTSDAPPSGPPAGA
jgi:hypothetical protein